MRGNGNSRILFDRFEDDSGPGRRDRWRGRDLLTQNLTQVLGVARADLQQVTIVTGDVVHFEDFGNAGQFVRGRHLGAVLGRPNGNKGQHAPFDHVRVDQRDVILDNALGFELPQPFENCRWSKTDSL